MNDKQKAFEEWWENYHDCKPLDAWSKLRCFQSETCAEDGYIVEEIDIEYQAFKGGTESQPVQAVSVPGPDAEAMLTRWLSYGRACLEAGETLPRHLVSETEAALAKQGPSILEPILAELDRAMHKFPVWPTDPIHASKILDEEIGELSKAVLQATYEPHKSGPTEVREEAIQAAAMAIRFIASLDKYEYTRATQHVQPMLANGDNGVSHE